jgi:hypothetical protein
MGSKEEVMQVHDVMTPDPVVVWPSTSVLYARRLMERNGFRHLPVMAGSRLVGIVSARDIQPTDRVLVSTLTALHSDLLAGRYRSVETVMSRPLCAISPRSPIRALRLDSSSVTEAVLARLTEMNSLSQVSLHESELQKPDSLLLRLSSMRLIRFFGNRISPQDEQRVRSLWPDAKVETGTFADTGENFVTVRRP